MATNHTGLSSDQIREMRRAAAEMTTGKRCPLCRGALIAHGSSLHCRSCGSTFDQE